MKNHDVHMLAVVRVKVAGVQAERHERAIELAQERVDLYQFFEGLNEGLQREPNREVAEIEWNEEVEGYLVDEEGDGDHHYTTHHGRWTDPASYQAVEDLATAAQSVIDFWEHGDLAEAVNELASALEHFKKAGAVAPDAKPAPLPPRAWIVMAEHTDGNPVSYELHATEEGALQTACEWGRNEAWPLSEPEQDEEFADFDRFVQAGQFGEAMGIYWDVQTRCGLDRIEIEEVEVQGAPVAPESGKIIVDVDGGLVQSVRGIPAGVTVEVRDWDCEGCPEFEAGEFGDPDEPEIIRDPDDRKPYTHGHVSRYDGSPSGTSIFAGEGG